MIDGWNWTICYSYVILCYIFDLSSRISDDTTDTDIFLCKLWQLPTEPNLKWKRHSTFPWNQTPAATSQLYRSSAVTNCCWLLDKERRPSTRDIRRIIVTGDRLPLNGSQMGWLIKAAPRLMLLMLMSISNNPTHKVKKCCFFQSVLISLFLFHALCFSCI